VSTPYEALRVQSFGFLGDCAAAVALKRSLRLNLAAHPRAAQAELGVTRRFKRGTDGQTTVLLPHLLHGSGERGVGLYICPSEVAAAQMILKQGS
jgi:hypothetical protein